MSSNSNTSNTVLREICFKQGVEANNENRKIYRRQRGVIVDCPYEKGTNEARWWHEGYQYRDMVNDG